MANQILTEENHGDNVLYSQSKDALEDFEKTPLNVLVNNSLKETYNLFAGNVGLKPGEIEECTATRLKIKIEGEYNFLNKIKSEEDTNNNNNKLSIEDVRENNNNRVSINRVLNNICGIRRNENDESLILQNVVNDENMSKKSVIEEKMCLYRMNNEENKMNINNNKISLNIRRPPNIPRPEWQRPWKLYRVISGHQGWVQCLAIDPANDWFASGGNDRLIKIWDLASGRLKLSLTGHVNSVRSIVISDRHPYMFSCGEDNKIKCWDLEQNKVVRDYHGHLSGVYCLTLHPSLDILCSGGRDAVVRVWDIRTKSAVHILNGHQGTIMSLLSQNNNPQLISGSQDKMIRLWDLVAGKCNIVLTNHKKSIRSMALHPSEYTFCSCAADNVKVWVCPNGSFDRNISGHNSIINCCTIKSNKKSSVLIAGTGNGQLAFWDWRSGWKYDVITSRVQPGSLECENCIFACILDKSETRLITGECDKTIKVWKEDENSTPLTHPINWVPPREFKRY